MNAMQAISIAGALVGLAKNVKDLVKSDKKTPHTVNEAPTKEPTRKEQHDTMHDLIARHKELIARIKENHNLIQSMKLNGGMTRQKNYVWEEIQADRALAFNIAQEIKSLKIALYGDKANNV